MHLISFHFIYYCYRYYRYNHCYYMCFICCYCYIQPINVCTFDKSYDIVLLLLQLLFQNVHVLSTIYQHVNYYKSMEVFRIHIFLSIRIVFRHNFIGFSALEYLYRFDLLFTWPPTQHNWLDINQLVHFYDLCTNLVRLRLQASQTLHLNKSE